METLELLTNYTVQFATYTAVIIAVIQGLKKFNIDSKYAIILSWVLGIAISLGLFSIQGLNGIPLIVFSLTNGIGLGAMANGLYQAIKPTEDK